MAGAVGTRAHGVGAVDFGVLDEFAAAVNHSGSRRVSDVDSVGVGSELKSSWHRSRLEYPFPRRRQARGRRCVRRNESMGRVDMCVTNGRGRWRRRCSAQPGSAFRRTTFAFGVSHTRLQHAGDVSVSTGRVGRGNGVRTSATLISATVASTDRAPALTIRFRCWRPCVRSSHQIADRSPLVVVQALNYPAACISPDRSRS